MSDSQFLAMAGSFTEEKFNELAAYRSGLKTGQFSAANRTEINQQVRKAFVAQNVKAEVTGKALQGLVVEMLVDALQLKIASERGGKSMTDEEVSKYVGEFLTNSFTPETWGFNTTHSFRAIASGNVAKFGSELEEILDKGLFEGQGIKEPTDLNRTKLMMEMLFFPNRNVAGAQAMVGYISSKDAELANQIKAALGARYTHAKFLETYLRARDDLITSTIVKAE